MDGAVFQFVNTSLANPFLDALLPFFSAQYLLVPSLVILAALLYVGAEPLRTQILRILCCMLIAAIAAAAAGLLVQAPPPYVSDAQRAFINNLWRLPASGAPIPLEPLRPIPYAACMAAILLFGFAGIRRWTLWCMLPLNACVLLAPAYCGWCRPGATCVGWGIGAASFLGVCFLWRDRVSAGAARPVALLREQPRERSIQIGRAHV